MLHKIDEFGELEDLETDGIWTEYVEFSKNPVQFTDDEVRRLYTFLSMLSAHQALVVGQHERAVAVCDFSLTNVKAKLLRGKYVNIKTMSARNSAVETDNDYLETLEILEKAEDNLTVEKVRLKALETASAAVSRDISARIKG